MPFMDGTGPLGDGSGSGRGRGRCGGAGRGVGRGMGFGRARANRAPQDPNASPEQQAGFLERQLDRIKRQISGQGGGQKA